MIIIIIILIKNKINYIISIFTIRNHTNNTDKDIIIIYHIIYDLEIEIEI